MSKITREQLAEEYARLNGSGSDEVQVAERAFLAGWDARKKLEEKELLIMSCACLKRLQQTD